MELSELIDSIDILEYIAQYAEFEKKGDEYWCLSPLQEERTPSFSVRRETNSFYDFSSGIGGNVFTFVKRYHHCSPAEAVRILAEYADINAKTLAPYRKLAATAVCKRFKPRASKPMTQNGEVFRENYMERFEKRPDKLAVWESEGISRASLDKFQVYYDAFSNRLVYPIRNRDGKIVNIGGRTLDPDFKAKKLRKYTYFSAWDGGINLLYGLYENMAAIKAAHEIIVFEGCKSVLMTDTWGIHNCAALLTSHLSLAQFKILAKLGCDVFFALDKEIDVTQDRNIQRLRQYVNVYYYRDNDGLLEPKDAPVDRGIEIFKKLYTQKRRYR